MRTNLYISSFKKLIRILPGVIIFFLICFIELKNFHHFLKSDAFKLKESTTTLIIGDSHPRCSLDPASIGHAQNLASSQENYFCSYYKLRYLLKANPQVKKIILGFSYHNISRFQEKILFRSDSTAYVFQKYFILFDSEGIRRLRDLNEDFLIYYLKYKMGVPFSISNDAKLFLTTINKDWQEKLPFWGGFYCSTRSNLSQGLTEEKIKLYFYNDDNNYCGKSELLRMYLYKIIQLCMKRNIQIYLFNAPLHSNFRKLVPRRAIEDFEGVKNEVLKKYPDIVYMDYTGSNLDDNLYGDSDHLNRLGASIISKEIRSVLKQ